MTYFTPKLITALFWAIAQGVAVNPYRRLGTTYRSRNVGREITTTRCVIARKNAVVIYLAEA